MPVADLTINAGDTQPVLTKTLEYSDLTPVDLNGKTVTFELRSMMAAQPVALTGAVTIIDAANGIVSYTFSAADSALPGNYIASFVVTAGSDTMTFPTEGYLWVKIQASLTGEAQQLVGLPDVKDYLGISGNDRTVDAKLMRWISAVRPLVEHITGPVLPQQFEEWHQGGQCYIMLHRRPSTALGTSPIITLVACSEYNGPIEWPLALVPSPDQGQLYSVMLNARLGQLVRRTAGGGEQPFPYGDQAVHVIYEAGQASVPDNVYEGTLELLRDNYMTTQPVGTGSQTLADEQDARAALPQGSYVSSRVKELLEPNKRFPSLA
jgi:hypothetical protein